MGMGPYQQQCDVNAGRKAAMDWKNAHNPSQFDEFEGLDEYDDESTELEELDEFDDEPVELEGFDELDGTDRVEEEDDESDKPMDFDASEARERHKSKKRDSGVRRHRSGQRDKWSNLRE